MRKLTIASLLILSIFISSAISSSISSSQMLRERYSLGETTNTIIIGTTDSVESTLDMAQSYDIFGWNIISCLSSGLVEIQPGSIAGQDDIVPALAESWSIFGGGTIWDFNLRHGVVFEDGSLFNASVVKYTFDRNCDLEGDGLLEPDGPQLNIGYVDIIDNVTIINDFKVRFYLKIPFAPFLQLLSIPSSYMVDPQYAPKDQVVEYSSGDPRGSHPCGLGPYLLDEWVRIGGSDEYISLVKNPDYWDAGSGEPIMDNIFIKMYGTDTGLAAAMDAGDVDIAFRQLSQTVIQTFQDSDTVQVFEELSPQIQYLCFNQDYYPFNEPIVRQAIGAALNRSGLCEAVFQNQKIPLLSIVPEDLEYHLPAFGVYGDANYSFTTAALAIFGYNEGNKLDLVLYYESSGHYPSSQQQALVYQMQLEATGVIDVTLEGLDWASYRMARNNGEMPVFIYGWYPDYTDADNFAFLPFASWLNLGYNSTYPAGGVAQYNLWVAGRSAMTDIGRRDAYYDLQELQAEECSVIPIWQGKQYLVADLSISGVYLDLTGLLRYWLLDTTETTTTTSSSTTTTTTTTTTVTSSTTTSTTTNTTGFELPVQMIILILSIGSAAVIIIVVIIIIRSRSGGG